MLSAGHLAASPSPLAAVQSPTQHTSTSTVTSAATPSIMSMAASLPQQVAGAAAGIPN